MKKIICTFLSVVSILTLILCLSACGEKENEKDMKEIILKELDNGNYEGAVKQFNDYLETVEGYDTDENNKTIQEIEKAFISQINQTYIDYRSGKKDYETAVREAEILEDPESYDIKEAHKKIWHDTEEVHNSRIAFDKAEELYEKGDYENAYQLYQYVIVEDELNYDTAQERINELKEDEVPDWDEPLPPVLDQVDENVDKHEQVALGSVLTDEDYENREKN